MENSLGLPDPDDVHVLAAAIAGRADVIVTANVQHFPPEALGRFGIQAQTPDDFVRGQISLDKDRVRQAVMNHWRSLKNPEFTLPEYLEMLEKQGLTGAAEALHSILCP